MSDMFNPENQGTNPEANVLETLVGEGKKFSDVEALARGKAEADLYIEQLKAELQKTQTVDTKLDELMTRLAEQEKYKSAEAQGQSSAVPQGQNSGTPDTTPSFKPEDVEALVKQTLEQEQGNRTKAQNLNMVESTMHQNFGDRAGDVVSTKARELGMSTQELQAMAETTPKAFLALVGIQEQAPQSNQTQMRGFNSDAISAAQGAKANGKIEKGWSHFKEMRKKDPNGYYRSMGEMQDLMDKHGSDVFFAS